MKDMRKKLKDKLALVELQMKVELEKIRVTLSQATDKGTLVENVFRTFLREYLPRCFQVGDGEIIDSKGHESKQTDIVIVDENHPFTFTQGNPGLFFIEGVCAAGEVKTNLTSVELEKALKNACQFKELEINAPEGTTIYGPDRFYARPPWFLVTFESQLTLSSIEAKLKEFERENSVKFDRMADAVFVLDQGRVINFGEGKDNLKFMTPDGTSRGGWIWQESDCVLFQFLSWLSAVMPRFIGGRPIILQYLLPSAESIMKRTNQQ